MKVVAVVGATGLVGFHILKILEETNFPLKDLRAFASERSSGEKIEFQGEKIPVELLHKASFKGIDLALFAVSSDLAGEFVPKATSEGCVVVDNSSRFRMEPDVPLVVPEVNPHRIDDYKNRGIIANPNCSTIQMVVVLKPLHDKAKAKRVTVATYQSTSGAGKEAMEELQLQTPEVLSGKKPKPSAFPHQIAFNLIPFIGSLKEQGFSEEEMKMILETKKIMEEEIKVCATCVRVPVFIGHSEAVSIEFERPISPEEARDILANSPGILVIDEPKNHSYPMPIHVAGRDEVFVGRIRKDPSLEFGLTMWVVADNLRKGAATNAVQIARILEQKI